MALYGIGFKAADDRDEVIEVSQLPYQVSQSVSQLETLEPLPDKDLSQSGKAGKPVSLLNEEIENDSTESQQPEKSDCQKADRADKLPYLAYNPSTVSNVGLPTALPTALPNTPSGLPSASALATEDEKASKAIPKVGDRVQIVLDCSRYRGQLGTVRGIEHRDQLVIYEVGVDGETKRLTYQQGDLQLVQGE